MKWWVVGFLALAACGFQASPADGTGSDPGAGSDPGDSTGGPPQGTPTADKVANLALGDSALGTADFTIGVAGGNDPAITIDTQRLAIGGLTLPAGVSFVTARQDGTGPELAVLHAKVLTIQQPVKVIGGRPLVIVCDSLFLSEQIDVTAHTMPASGRASDPSALTGDASGAVELYAHTLLSVSGLVNAGDASDHFGPPGGGGNQRPGVLVVQSRAISNTGSLVAIDGDGSGNSGQLFWISSSTPSGNLSPDPTTVAP
ncbi:MAG TPA: hypothetical protein VFP84_32090 [Kofleriaceae bacterium]|nr:hypothetical protein [Kofleriaceae bacterium]